MAVIKTGLDPQRSILAGVNHPNLAQASQRTASSNAIAVNLALAMLVERKPCSETREKILAFLRRVSKDWMSRLPHLTDLPILSRLNALDALMRNALILQIPFELLETDDFDSKFIVYGPQSALTLPPCLGPTTLQRTVTHHSWLDLFPIPRMRDNILWGIKTGQLNEDQLCDALCCDLVNLTAESTSNLVIWGEPWDITGWEFSDSFFKRWGTLRYGYPEVLKATNHWRSLRGERRLLF